jgi:hypothetical protein
MNESIPLILAIGLSFPIALAFIVQEVWLTVGAQLLQ